MVKVRTSSVVQLETCISLNLMLILFENNYTDQGLNYAEIDPYINQIQQDSILKIYINSSRKSRKRLRSQSSKKFIPHDQHSMLPSASTQLQSLDHWIVPIMGDGNCLFRALSKLTYGNKEWHSFIRQALVKFISLNCEVFQSYCTEDITDHLR